jgi:hypothetical protein
MSSKKKRKKRKKIKKVEGIDDNKVRYGRKIVVENYDGEK